MTDSNEFKAKLKLLGDIFSELKDHSPSELRNFLNEYKNFVTQDDDKFINKSKVDAFSQTEDPTETNAWNIENLAEDVTTLAKKVTLETGYSYDENSGWYYDQKTNCYYNSNHRLYYYAEHKAYYYYDEESKGLKFYCSLPSQSDQNCIINNLETKGIQIPRREDLIYNISKNAQTSGLLKKIENTEVVKSNDGKEEGECSSSDEEVTDNLSQSLDNPSVIKAAPTVFQPDNTKYFAPCIRVIVKSSSIPNLCNGTLFIVTCTGGTLGREGNHDVLIPDHLVSKVHSKFQYVCKDGLYFYELIDLGSKNGTFVNGKRLSDALVQSEPTTITHGSIINVGHTELLCHIHPFDETCTDCVPLTNAGKENNGKISSVTLKEKHKLETALIRKKFGISNYYTAKHPEGYEDRAEVRRKQVGSSHDSEKTDSASINEPICKKNKGYSLLSKMGWKEGDTLGKGNDAAILEPIQILERNEKTKIGLGCDIAYQDPETKSKKQSLAMKTLERFKQVK